MHDYTLNHTTAKFMVSSSEIVRKASITFQKTGLPSQDYRKKELLRITQENQAILKRIQRAQPMYNHVKWEEQHKYSFGLTVSSTTRVHFLQF